MTRLVLIRHGVTEWNLQKRIQGRIDQPLCAQGRRQLRALAIADEFQQGDWYCSPLRRARETAELLGLKSCRIEPALTEMDWGDWEGQILKPLRKQLGDAMRNNESRGLDFRPPGGESPREVQARLLPWLTHLAKRAEPAGAVVHKGIIRCMYALACGWDMRGEAPVEFAWDAMHRFELEADGSLLDRYEAIPLVKTRAL
jgi:broad specificity phosphatase PhoE